MIIHLTLDSSDLPSFSTEVLFLSLDPIQNPILHLFVPSPSFPLICMSFLIFLFLQFISYMCTCIYVLMCVGGLMPFENAHRVPQPWPIKWGLFLACVSILVRSGAKVKEMSARDISSLLSGCVFLSTLLSAVCLWSLSRRLQMHLYRGLDFFP